MFTSVASFNVTARVGELLWKALYVEDDLEDYQNLSGQKGGLWNTEDHRHNQLQ
jgi:hypothetical protein